MIVNDPLLNEKLRQSGIAYINAEGAICTNEPDHPSLDEIKDIIQSSPNFLGGRHMGIEPKVKAVTEEDFQRNYSLLIEATTKKDEIRDETDVADGLDQILIEMIERGASDAHIRITENHTILLARIDGKLTTLKGNQSREFGEKLLSYAFIRKAKQKWNIKGDYDGTFDIGLAVSNDVEKEYSFRLSQMPSEGGAKATIRNLDSGSGDDHLTLEQLGLSAGHIKYFIEALNQSQGAILISGPTGSGKTTLVCSALLVVSEDEDRLIHTLEDPVEWNLSKRNIIQTTVDPLQRIGNGVEGFKDFAYMGKKLLRNDTDLCYVGEVRDHETAKTLLRMAETGQVAVATLHCNSAISAIGTMIEQMSIHPALLSSPGVIRALGHQRLIRTICKKCGIPHRVMAEKHMDMAKTDQQAYSRVEDLISEYCVTEHEAEKVRDTVRYMNRAGCSHCIGGEKGRTALFELVLLDDEARDYISKRDMKGWEKDLKAKGWPSIRDHGRSKIFRGLADIRAVESQVSSLKETPLESAYGEMKEEW
ncbi:GspE/PulE family protein [Vibrio agarivorans]|uniref:ATPase, T2SS/T4P/T4SS family n=1 Tax=Vibrio agarivorans TaxID=153622 RepID=A0ABT7Y7G4_9VIBR|nr:ATPase, T2SS/T4P/T4SS family [Vibrio agarivorans]MDN2483969.1 ATPase, T2SS/T4P/T4SS family [Vibrio agarivorans]